jgi:hypothetical protein
VKTTDTFRTERHPAPDPAPPAAVRSALAAIDGAIASFAGRTYVPASDVVDALLEIRLVVELEDALTPHE